MEAEINIYTYDFKMEDETEYAFWVFRRGELIYEDQAKLNKENTVFHAELLVIEEALQWIRNSPHKIVIIQSFKSLGNKRHFFKKSQYKQLNYFKSQEQRSSLNGFVDI